MHPILPPANRFVLRNALPLLHALSGPQFSIETVRRHQDADWVADHFFSGVAEDTLRAFVPTGDDALQIFANDCDFG